MKADKGSASDRRHLRDQNNLRSGRVMTMPHSGAFWGSRIILKFTDLARNGYDLLTGNGTFAKDNGTFAGAIHDSRFKPDLGRVSLQDAVDPAVEILENRLPRRRTRPARQIRRRCNNRHPAGLQKLTSDVISRHTHTNRV